MKAGIWETTVYAGMDGDKSMCLEGESPADIVAKLRVALTVWAGSYARRPETYDGLMFWGRKKDVWVVLANDQPKAVNDLDRWMVYETRDFYDPPCSALLAEGPFLEVAADWCSMLENRGRFFDLRGEDEFELDQRDDAKIVVTRNELLDIQLRLERLHGLVEGAAESPVCQEQANVVIADTVHLVGQLLYRCSYKEGAS